MAATFRKGHLEDHLCQKRVWTSSPETSFLGGRFGYIFNFFSARGGGRGSPRRREGGVRFLLKIPGGGGLQEGRPRGRRASAAHLGIGRGGGAKYFFSGPKCPASFEAKK